MKLTTIVVDADVLLDALLASGERGEAARAAISGYSVAGPEHLQAETFHLIRHLVIGGRVTEEAGQRAVARLGRLAVETVPTSALLERMWQLRDNLSGYDAAYLAAAEHLQVDLLTRDAAILAATGVTSDVRRP